MTELEIPAVRTDGDIPMPQRANPCDAGLDLRASEDAVLTANAGRALIPTGLSVAIPEGYAGFVQPRSGLALKHGVTCLNTPGLVDSGYRGELKVILVNTDPFQDYHVRKGDRIAQLVVQKVEHARLVETEELPVSSRGEKGFGSSGS